MCNLRVYFILGKIQFCCLDRQKRFKFLPTSVSPTIALWTRVPLKTSLASASVLECTESYDYHALTLYVSFATMTAAQHSRASAQVLRSWFPPAHGGVKSTQ